MFPLWLVLGTVTILAGIFDRKMLRLLGYRPMSEVLTTPNLKYSTKTIEQLGQWLVVTLGISFLVLGLSEALPNNLSHIISFLLLGSSGFMLLAIIGITIANWKAK